MITFLSAVRWRNVTVSFPAIVKIVLFDTMREGQYVFTIRIKSLLQEITKLFHRIWNTSHVVYVILTFLIFILHYNSRNNTYIYESCKQ